MVFFLNQVDKNCSLSFKFKMPVYLNLTCFFYILYINNQIIDRRFIVIEKRGIIRRLFYPVNVFKHG